MSIFNAKVLDRFCWVLSLIGIYISGYLTASKAYNQSIACSNSSGCDIVTNSAKAYIFGVPIAYIGLGGYLILTALTLARIIAPRLHRPLLFFAFLGATLGLGSSLLLTYISVFQIHDVCRWCMASGITMGLIWLCTGLTVTLPAPEKSSDVSSLASLTLTGMIAAGVVITVQIQGSFANVKRQMQAVRKDQIKLSELIPPDAHVMGKHDAPYSIVTFSDLVCPNCKNADLKLFGRFRKGMNANLVFRHRPLEFHTWAYESAVLAEAAAETMDFYRFAEDAFNSEFDSLEQLKSFAIKEGVPEDLVESALKSGSKERQIVDRDLKLCRKLNIQAVPTIMLVHGTDVKIMSSDDAMAAVR